MIARVQSGADFDAGAIVQIEIDLANFTLSLRNDSGLGGG